MFGRYEDAYRIALYTRDTHSGLGSVTASIVKSTSLGATTVHTGSITRSVSVSTPSSTHSGTAAATSRSSATGKKNVAGFAGVLGAVLAVVGQL